MITRINYNWRQCGNFNDDLGEDYDFYEVGTEGVAEITEHHAQGVKWFYDVIFADGKKVRIFNPNKVFIGSEK